MSNNGRKRRIELVDGCRRPCIGIGNQRLDRDGESYPGDKQPILSGAVDGCDAHPAHFFEPITFNWDANVNRVRNIAREFSRYTKKQ